MSETYTWRPNGGLYYNSSGTSDTAANHFYYSSNRSFRMHFPALPVDKKTLSIKKATLHVTINTAYSATLTFGYSYNTAWADRKSLLASISGISMGTATGSKSIDITSIIQAYCKDGISGTMYLWAYGTAGSTSNSHFRGYNPASSYTSQRPYITLEYDNSKARIYLGGEWKTAVPHIYHNGAWKVANIQAYNNGWK